MRLLFVLWILSSRAFFSESSKTSELCVELEQGESGEDTQRLVGHSVNFSVLPRGWRAYACDSKLLLITGFFTDQEVEGLRREFETSKKHMPEWVEQRLSGLMPSGQHPSNSFLHYAHDEHLLSPHYDFTGTPFWFATILAYIVRPASGGHTLFPLLRPSGDQDQMDRQKLAELMQDHEGRNSPEALEIMDGMCQALRLHDDRKDITAYPYFGVVPEPGSAILYWHYSETSAGLLADHSTSGLHTICPFEGGERLLFRSFRTRPDGVDSRFEL